MGYSHGTYPPSEQFLRPCSRQRRENRPAGSDRTSMKGVSTISSQKHLLRCVWHPPCYGEHRLGRPFHPRGCGVISRVFYGSCVHQPPLFLCCASSKRAARWSLGYGMQVANHSTRSKRMGICGDKYKRYSSPPPSIPLL